MNRQDKEKELKRLWIEHPITKPASKWYESDKADFSRYISSLDTEKFEQVYNNWKVMWSPQFEKDCQKEINKLDKAGMFNIGNLSPKHQLD
jgi:hypothetical protein